MTDTDIDRFGYLYKYSGDLTAEEELEYKILREEMKNAKEYYTKFTSEITDRKYIDNELEKHYQCYMGIVQFLKELDKEPSMIGKFLAKEIKNRCKIP